MSKVIVVGGGASGMMAALSASKNNNEVILVERNGELGRKLRATGGGRCNFTNNREIEDFFDKVVSNKNFSIVVSIHLQIKTLFRILKVEIWNIRLKKKMTTKYTLKMINL